VVADTVFTSDHAGAGATPTAAGATLAHVALVAVPLLAAEALRNHRSYVALLLERLTLAERTREDEARRRVEQERLRIARDLHDVVAHTLTTINVQSGVAAHLLDRQPEHAHAALAVIEEASRDALGELRAMVGVLRDRDDNGAPLEPAPTVEAVEQLVHRARGAGLGVSLAVSGERPRRLSDAVEVAAFRIVQESLTNVTRHASDASASVRLSFGPDRLVVVIENDGGARSNGEGMGVGIVGMKERAGAVGGALHASPFPGGFRVAAELPYRLGA
jgi:signal transduction histidine kinase